MTTTAHALAGFHDYEPEQADFLSDVITGLGRERKAIPPKYFYDQRGSELFDEICRQPEYYPTRTEIGILQQNAPAIAGRIGPDCMLVELGSGASDKVRLLFDTLSPASYFGVDISRDFLLSSTRRLARDYPWLDVHAVCADFTHGLRLPEQCRSRSLVAFFPGSSIGNFEPERAVGFLGRLADMLGQGGRLLIGVDLKKPAQILHDAYNDAAGVTAAFNLNLLTRMQHELGAGLDRDGFAHEAFYNEAAGRIEMHLVSRREQSINLPGLEVTLARDENIHTENSYKYSLEEFAGLAQRAGFALEQVWCDPDALFSVQLYSVSAR